MFFDLLSKEQRSLENPSKPITMSQLASMLSWGDTDSGVSVTNESALRIITVFACVRVIAETIGSLPLHVYKKTADGRESVDEHPVVKFLTEAPNQMMSSGVFRETLTGHTVMRGNGFALIDRDQRGQVKRLLPLPPDKCKPKRHGWDGLTYDIDTEHIKIKDVPAKDILHIPGLGFDGISGYNPIQLARQALGLAIATEKHGAKLFKNGARPGGLLIHPSHLKEAAAQRIAASWQAIFGGVDNSHKVAVLEEGMKWESVGMSNEDAQFLDTRKFQRSEICALFRVPPHMVADLEKATFSNIEHQGQEFVAYTLLPWLVRWESEINRKLLPGGKYFVKHNVTGLLRGDAKSRHEAYGSAIDKGWMTRNEVRALEDYNKIDGLDKPLVPLNMVPEGGETDEEN